jgi:replicative DNA helicase
MQFSQTPPHRLELEQTIIGAMLIDTTAYYVANEQQPIQEEDFYLHKHQILYRCIQSLANKNKDIDLVSIFTEIQKQTIQIDVSELMELTQRVASSANLNTWVMELKELAMRRQLIVATHQAHQKAFDMSIDALDLVSEAQAQTTAITDNLTGTAQSVSKALDIIEIKATQPLKSKGLQMPTDITTLDRIINGGVEEEDFIVIGGRPSQGKTALALNFVLALLKQGKEVAIFTYEMTTEQLLRRLLSSYAQIPQDELKKGQLDNMYIQDYSSGINFLRKVQDLIHIYDCAGMTVEVLKAKAKALKIKRKELAAIFIDYAQLINTRERIRDENVKAQYIIHELMYLKKGIKTPIVLLSQLRKSAGEAAPTSADLYGSQAIEADATKVLLVYRPEHYKIPCFADGEDAVGKGEVLVAKNRDGGLGVARLDFRGQTTTWKDIETFDTGMPF